jgi:hypothetical protein
MGPATPIRADLVRLIAARPRVGDANRIRILDLMRDADPGVPLER